jgi:hypothetical protein
MAGSQAQVKSLETREEALLNEHEIAVVDATVGSAVSKTLTGTERELLLFHKIMAAKDERISMLEVKGAPILERHATPAPRPPTPDLRRRGGTMCVPGPDECSLVR